ncbi:ATP-binding protein [Belnapia moabensis]|uniref:ATP-binding protein n=1 Tax=Belnapia moabensis TaxID=365533 RepID=UPI000694FD08|nr:ATP-binding protein [Belnapia moabensis]
MLLFALRDTVSPWIAIIPGNIGLGLGYGLLWNGARQFSGRKVDHVGLFAGAIVWSAACLLPDFLNSLPARVALSSATIAAYSVLIAFVLREGMARQRLPSHRAAIGVLLAHGVVHALRSASALILPFETSGTAPPEASWNVVLTILAITLISSVAVLLLALAGERTALASNVVLAAARDAAASASREKSRFLARMSHELRTPLNGVLGMAQVLARDPSLGPKQREQARTLESAGRHLLAIVNDVLDLARIEAGRLDLSPQPVRLREWLAEVLDLIRGAALEKRLTLRLDVANDVPRAVLADPVRLRQILLNLLGNAVKFTPEDGAITLRAEWTPTGALRLTITDSGPGVPPELRDSLFGEFNQGRREIAAGVGTGLGLAISSALARSMGGTLEYVPGPDGQGSSFSATLPLPTALLEEEPTPVQDSPPLTPTRPLRLLVVDDVPANRMLARALLEAEGHLVEEAADGRSAIEALASGALPDAVLMDVSMPEIDGYATTALIRRLEGPAARVPIIAVTANAMPEDAAASRAVGMDGFLTKPLEFQALRMELARALPSR